MLCPKAEWRHVELEGRHLPRIQMAFVSLYPELSPGIKVESASLGITNTAWQKQRLRLMYSKAFEFDLWLCRSHWGFFASLRLLRGLGWAYLQFHRFNTLIEFGSWKMKTLLSECKALHVTCSYLVRCIVGTNAFLRGLRWGVSYNKSVFQVSKCASCYILVQSVGVFAENTGNSCHSYVKRL